MKLGPPQTKPLYTLNSSVTKTSSQKGKFVLGENCFEGQIGSGAKLSSGLFIVGGLFVSGGFCPRWLLVGWLMARWLLFGDFFWGAFDHIPFRLYSKLYCRTL